MALVYEARRDSLAGVSPRVAIKLILPEHQGSETFKQLFINEARLGSSMHHQNLVQIQDFDSDGEKFFLVMEYVEGLTLRRCIALCDRYGLTMPMGVVAEIGRQACDGLHYAHEAVDDQGDHLALVHRDVKPSNIILNPHGIVKVLDFGISKGALREERKGSVKGTWGYMAPEQATGRGVTPASDVFGLAVVLYEMAALLPMFMDKNKDEIKRLLADDHGARMIATLPPEYAPLVRVLIRATQRDPLGRYASGEDFARALSALLPDPITARDEVVRFFERVHALDQGRKQPGAVVHEAAVNQGSLLAEPEDEPNRSLAWAVTVGASLLLAVGMLAATLGLGAALLGAPPEGLPVGPSLEEVVGDQRPSPTRPPPGLVDDPPAAAAELPPGDGSVKVRVVRTDDGSVEVPEAEAGGDLARAPSVSVTRIEAPVRPPAPVRSVVKPNAALIEPDDKNGVLWVGSRQDAEIYLGGQFASTAPLKRKLPPGRYAVSIVSADGRRRSIEVEVVAGKRVKKIWDFERNSWR
jgi:hypothetical protein